MAAEDNEKVEARITLGRKRLGSVLTGVPLILLPKVASSR